MYQTSSYGLSSIVYLGDTTFRLSMVYFSGLCFQPLKQKCGSSSQILVRFLNKWNHQPAKMQILWFSLVFSWINHPAQPNTTHVLSIWHFQLWGNTHTVTCRRVVNCKARTRKLAIRATRYLGARPALLNGCKWSATILTQSRLSATRLFWKNQQKTQESDNWHNWHNWPTKICKNLERQSFQNKQMRACDFWISRNVSGLSTKRQRMDPSTMWVSSLVHVANTQMADK